MTPEELKEIDKRATEATPAPWRVNQIAGYTVDQIHACSEGEPFSNQNYVATAEGPNYSKDAVFIAHARTDVPALLAHIREQEVYIMAGELMEKFPGIEIGPDGRDSVTFGWDLLSHYNNGLLSWESAVRDAYQTLLEEAN